MKRYRIFFLHDSYMSWALRDMKILEKDHIVIPFDLMKEFNSNSTRKINISTYISMIKAFIKMFKLIKKSDIMFAWFIDTPSGIATVLSKLLGKRTIIVVGGYDIDNVPEINYGSMGNTAKSLFNRFILRICDLTLPFSVYAENKLKDISKSIRFHTCRLACDTDYFRPSKNEKEAIVISVGHIKKDNISRKGFDIFVKSARYLPKNQFYLIGNHFDDAIDILRPLASENVIFTGRLTDDELLSMYQRAKVFCLLSYTEGEAGGGVTGEAMACGCIPIVTKEAEVFKETVGNCGFYVNYGDEKDTVKAIEKALNQKNDLGQRARRNIIRLHSYDEREHNLNKAISYITKN